MVSLGIFCSGFLPRCSGKIRAHDIDFLTFNWSQLTRNYLNVLDLEVGSLIWHQISTCIISIVIVFIVADISERICSASPENGKSDAIRQIYLLICRGTSRSIKVSAHQDLRPSHKISMAGRPSWGLYHWQCGILRLYLDRFSFLEWVQSNLVFWKCHKGYSFCIPMGSPPYTICQMMLTFIEVPQAKLFYQKVWQGNILLRRTGS